MQKPQAETPSTTTQQAGNLPVTTEQQARQMAARMAVRGRNSHSTQQECRSLVLRRQQACVNRDLLLCFALGPYGSHTIHSGTQGDDKLRKYAGLEERSVATRTSL